MEVNYNILRKQLAMGSNIRTTSGKVEKPLCLRFKYRRRESEANSVGRVVSQLFPRASLTEGGVA